MYTSTATWTSLDKVIVLSQLPRTPLGSKNVRSRPGEAQIQNGTLNDPRLKTANLCSTFEKGSLDFVCWSVIRGRCLRYFRILPVARIFVNFNLHVARQRARIWFLLSFGELLCCASSY